MEKEKCIVTRSLRVNFNNVNGICVVFFLLPLEKATGWVSCDSEWGTEVKMHRFYKPNLFVDSTGITSLVIRIGGE